MKKLVIVLAVLVAICLIAPFGIGRVAEQRVNAQLDKLIEQAPYLKIAKREWTSGWFKSEQVVTFGIAEPWAKLMTPAVLDDAIEEQAEETESAAEAAAMEPEAPAADAAEEDASADEATGEEAAEDGPAPDAGVPRAEDLTFTVRNSVLHGPVLGLSGLGLARVDSHVDLSPDVQKKIREVFGEKPALEVRSRVGFLGGITTTFTSEGRKLTPKSGEGAFEYETFKLSMGLGRDWNSYDLDGKWPRFSFKDKSGGEFTVTDLIIDGDGKRVMGDLYEGDASFTAQEIQVRKAGAADAVIVKDAHYMFDTGVKDDFADVLLKLGTGAVTGSPELAQAGVDIKEIHYDFSLRHLHAPTLDKMSQSFRAMYAAPLAEGTDAEKVVFGALKENAGELLKHDPVLGIDRVGLVTPDGEIVTKGVIKFVGVTAEDFSGGAPMALIGKLDADITIEAAQKVIEKFPNGATMAGGAVDSGYAKRDGDKLVCQIQFKNGQLTINGKPQAIPGLGGPPPGAMEEGAMEEGAMEDGAMEGEPVPEDAE
jgi:uncharacterized protein YdgA (DUF945 family)